jgi:hypothetical protein
MARLIDQLWFQRNRRERQDTLAREVADDVDLEAVGAVDAGDRRGGPSMKTYSLGKSPDPR